MRYIPISTTYRIECSKLLTLQYWSYLNQGWPKLVKADWDWLEDQDQTDPAWPRLTKTGKGKRAKQPSCLSDWPNQWPCPFLHFFRHGLLWSNGQRWYISIYDGLVLNSGKEHLPIWWNCSNNATVVPRPRLLDRWLEEEERAATGWGGRDPRPPCATTQLFTLHPADMLVYLDW